MFIHSSVPKMVKGLPRRVLMVSSPPSLHICKCQAGSHMSPTTLELSLGAVRLHLLVRAYTDLVQQQGLHKQAGDVERMWSVAPCPLQCWPITRHLICKQ